MKKMKLLLITVLLTSSLTACSTHSGNIRASDNTIIEKIKIGKTTKADARILLGDAQNTMSDGNGKDTWTYDYTQTNRSARAFIPFVNMVGETPVDVKNSELIIIFNKDGVVENVVSRSNES